MFGFDATKKLLFERVPGIQPVLPRLWVFCDGGTGSVWQAEADIGMDNPGPRVVGERRQHSLEGLLMQAGCGAAARNDEGYVVEWAWQALPAMTNNEAEYAGLLLGAQLAARHAAHELVFVMDSKIVVGQMRGRYRVNSPALRKWHREACRVMRQFPQVRYRLVAREFNVLADALAQQARLPWPQVRQILERDE